MLTIEKPEAVKEGDVVVAEIPAELLSQRNQAVDYGRTAIELTRKGKEAAELSEATMKLFWAEVKRLNERAETSESRGMMLSLRERDSKLVAIEQKKPQCQCLFCQLKRQTEGDKPHLTP